MDAIAEDLADDSPTDGESTYTIARVLDNDQCTDCEPLRLLIEQRPRGAGSQRRRARLPGKSNGAWTGKIAKCQDFAKV